MRTPAFTAEISIYQKSSYYHILDTLNILSGGWEISPQMQTFGCMFDKATGNAYFPYETDDGQFCMGVHDADKGQSYIVCS